MTPWGTAATALDAWRSASLGRLHCVGLSRDAISTIDSYSITFSYGNISLKEDASRRRVSCHHNSKQTCTHLQLQSSLQLIFVYVLTSSVVPNERSNACIVTESSGDVPNVSANERISGVQRQRNLLRLAVDDDLARQRGLEDGNVLEVEGRRRVERLKCSEVGRRGEDLRFGGALQRCEGEGAEWAEDGVGISGELELERCIVGVCEERTSGRLQLDAVRMRQHKLSLVK